MFNMFSSRVVEDLPSFSYPQFDLSDKERSEFDGDISAETITALTAGVAFGLATSKMELLAKDNPHFETEKNNSPHQFFTGFFETADKGINDIIDFGVSKIGNSIKSQDDKGLSKINQYAKAVANGLLKDKLSEESVLFVKEYIKSKCVFEDNLPETVDEMIEFLKDDIRGEEMTNLLLGSYTKKNQLPN